MSLHEDHQVGGEKRFEIFHLKYDEYISYEGLHSLTHHNFPVK